MQKYEFQGNKKKQVLGTHAEKIDKCPAVELGVPRYPPKENIFYEMIKI